MFDVVTQVLPWLNAICALLLAGTMLALRMGYWGGTAMTEFRAVLTRLDHAGEEISTLASKVQGLPEELRRIFLPREVADQWVLETRRELERLRVVIDDLQRHSWRDSSSRTRHND